MPTFDGNEGTFITLSEGANMTSAYREANPDAIKGLFFGKNKLLDLLNQTGCVGIRIYFAIDDETKEAGLVLVGAKENTNDITSGYIIDHGISCPPVCGADNDLNS
ncbi:MAG: hypothetical protein IPH78_04385 [Bacteroidetes bacterium]|nr:hypothetical protein [Bacteroidota bacterium]